MITTRVRLKDRGYPICVGGSWKDLDVRQWGGPFAKKVLVVSDNKVVHHYARTLLASLKKKGFDPALCVIPSGEQHKTLETAQKVWSQAFQHGLERRSVIFALGGGVVGDLTGFVAATCLRGVPFVQVPTTLLAQVDAAVGGKVAVDALEGKNLIGAFYQPLAVWMDVGTLKTLPIREWRNGMAEVIKYGVISDNGLFKMLEHEAWTFGHWTKSFLEKLVFRCARIKADVVEKDERESSGLREKLNFGHTLGHAIEAATHYKSYTHGEAVALGMMAAAFLGSKLCGFKDSRRLEALISAYGLPVKVRRHLSRKRVLECLKQDKKVRDSVVRFVLPKRLGHVVSGLAVPERLLTTAMQRIGL